MKAIGYKEAGPIGRDDALVDVELAVPVAEGHDILVRVEAISVNPVDYKIRRGVAPINGAYKILGWDAAGEVVAVGEAVTAFKPGDMVYYAGAINRDGTNAEFHLVDERLVGKMPSNLSCPEAAALPLTALTAWEMLFDRLRVDVPVPGAAPAVLIIGGAGGVGSIATQLLRARTGLTVIATASRPESMDWVRKMGAHHVINHHEPMAPQIEALGLGAPAFVFSTNESGQHAEQIIELIAPQGRFGLIDDPKAFVIDGFKRKSVSVHWELMFTRSLFQTADMAEQSRILNAVTELVEVGKVQTTMTNMFGMINASNLKRAHALLEEGKARGKLVLTGFA